MCPNGNIVDVGSDHSAPLSCGCVDSFMAQFRLKPIKEALAKENLEKTKDKCVKKFKDPLQYYSVGKGQKFCFHCAENCILKSAKKELVTFEGNGIGFDCGCGDCNP